LRGRGDIRKTIDSFISDRAEYNVNGRKKISNSTFVQCIDREVGFFEAWVSVFDGVLNWKSGLSTLALAGETECGTVPTQNRGDATTRGIASCFGASMTLRKKQSKRPQPQHKPKSRSSQHDKRKRLDTPNPRRK